MKPLHHMNLYNPQNGVQCLAQGLRVGVMEEIYFVFFCWIEKDTLMFNSIVTN